MIGSLQRLIWVLLALLVTAQVSAGLYKWTDAEGNVHYSDAPPANQKTETLNPRTAAPSGADEEKAKLDKQVEEFNKRQEAEKQKQEDAQKAAEEKKIRQEQCATLRRNLQLYLTKNRVSKMVDGEKVVVPYEERVKDIEKIEKQIKEACID